MKKIKSLNIKKLQFFFSKSLKLFFSNLNQPKNLNQSLITTHSKMFFVISKIFLITTFLFSIDATPKTEHCTLITNLFDKQGELIKKVCEIRMAFSYEKAENNCIKNGMNLLVFESFEVFEEFSRKLDESSKALGNVWGPSKGYWINGRRNYKGDWLTYTLNAKQQLNPQIPFTHGTAHSDICLALKRDGIFKVSGYQCSQAYYHLCEFQVVKAEHSNCFDFENLVRSGN